MRKLLPALLVSTLLLSCGHFGQFQEGIEDLVLDWERSADPLQDLTAEVTEEEKRLDAFMDSKPVRTGLIGHFGEDYLAQSDQLNAKLIGHKGRFDQLSRQIRDFAEEWDRQQPELEALREGLAAGRLPAKTRERVGHLSAFVTKAAEKITAWESELEETVRQFDLVARQLGGSR